MDEGTNVGTSEGVVDGSTLGCKDGLLVLFDGDNVG